nr:MAG TPA: putative transporter [Bacteriophage sp.]
MSGKFPTLSLLSRGRLKLCIVSSLPCPSCWVSLIISSRF